MRLTALALAVALLGAAQPQPKIERLRDVRKIYVAPLGQGAGAEELRQRMINNFEA
ncbi:MAG TPA: hypothetical protein VN428_12820 [Bryobacteraceae bacterium]|nr:hypothetical protein [Bryobacteraceae bacterium]